METARLAWGEGAFAVWWLRGWAWFRTDPNVFSMSFYMRLCPILGLREFLAWYDCNCTFACDYSVLVYLGFLILIGRENNISNRLINSNGKKG